MKFGNKKFLLDKLWSKISKMCKSWNELSVLSYRSAANIKYTQFNFSVPALKSKAQLDTKTHMETRN